MSAMKHLTISAMEQGAWDAEHDVFLDIEADVDAECIVAAIFMRARFFMPEPFDYAWAAPLLDAYHDGWSEAHSSMLDYASGF